MILAPSQNSHELGDVEYKISGERFIPLSDEDLHPHYKVQRNEALFCITVGQLPRLPIQLEDHKEIVEEPKKVIEDHSILPYAQVHINQVAEKQNHASEVSIIY